MSEQTKPDQNKVVHLNADRTGGAPHIALTRLPAPMHALRDKARQQLQTLLRDLFDKADDALFELADKAGNNHEQNLYFDSMREVRIRRRTMEAAFFRSIDISFARLLDHNAYRTSAESEAPSLDELSLVRNDELEEMVATETMINKANEQFAEAVQHLTMRIGHLVPEKVYQKNNPVGVDVICHAFIEAAKLARIDVKAKLVLFKLFDNLVMSKLGGLFEVLNQLLIDANIMPSLKTELRAKKTPATPASSSAYSASGGYREGEGVRPVAHGATGYDEQTNQVLHTLRDLLGSRHSVSPAARNVGDEVASQDLVRILSQAQHQHSTYAGSSYASAGAPIDVRNLLQNLLTHQSQHPVALNQVDEDVINLVSMMFDFILDDRNLAAPMKALLGRLQIPMVKVAIADKSFFSKGGHPARRLLNEMAMAALGWQENTEENQRKDSLFNKMEEIVQKILSDFDTDMTIFSNLLSDFRAYLDKERRRAQILEQRTIDAEDGKAKSERARADVDETLAQVIADHELPASASKLLHDAWANVMFITSLKHGTDSEEWQACVTTAQELVWSLTAPMAKDNRQQLLKLVPRLLQHLRQGLESIAYNPFETTQLFKELERLHLARLRAAAVTEPAAATKPLAEAASPDEVAPEPVVAEKEASPQPVAAVNQTTAADLPAEQVQVQVKTVEVQVKSGEQTDVQAERFFVLSAPESTLAEDDQHLSLVNNITQGSWFEMTDAGGQKYRCRLAAIIKATGKYIFVNRSGMKVAEETRQTLASALRSGKLRVLDDGMLFDRALEAVIGTLREQRTTSN